MSHDGARVAFAEAFYEAVAPMVKYISAQIEVRLSQVVYPLDYSVIGTSI